MEYKTTIKGFDSGLNEVLNGVIFDWKTKRVINPVKRRNDELILKQLRVSNIKNVKLNPPIVIHYDFYCKDRRRDRMNVASAFDKSFQDSLQTAGILKNDGWYEVLNATFSFDLDKANTRVEITITEVEPDKTSKR